MQIALFMIIAFSSQAYALPRLCWPFASSSNEQYQVRELKNLENRCAKAGDLEGCLLYRFLSQSANTRWEWQFKQGKLRVSFESNLKEHNPLPLAIGSFLAYLSEGRVFVLRGIPGEGVFAPKFSLRLGEQPPQYRVSMRVRPNEMMEALPEQGLVSLATLNATNSPLHTETVHLFEEPHQMLVHVERLDMLAVQSDIAWIELHWEEGKLRELRKRVRKAFAM